MENVGFIGLELTSINLVENLKKHENVKEDGEVLSSLFIPFTNTNG